MIDLKYNSRSASIFNINTTENVALNKPQFATQTPSNTVRLNNRHLQQENSIQQEGFQPHYLNEGDFFPKGNRCNTLQNDIFDKLDTFKTYVPESLDIPDSCPCKPQIAYLFGLIYWKQLERWNRLDDATTSKRDVFIELHSALLKKVIPDWSKVWHWCEALGLIERNHYCKGEKSYGYRAAEPYRTQTYRLRTFHHKVLAKRIRARVRQIKTTPMCVHMKANLARLSVDAALWSGLFPDDPNRQHHTAQLQTIIDGELRCWPDQFSGRIHHNVSNMFSGCRTCLRVDGEPDFLTEIDIKNSQPLFLALASGAKGLFLELCQQGKFYEFLADKVGCDRATAKEAMMVIMFDKNRKELTKAKRVFAESFPDVWKYICNTKRTDYRRLARQMQKAERRFILDTVCDRLKSLGLFFVTIHDAILCRGCDSWMVLEIMQHEFLQLGVSPVLEPTELTPPQTA